MAIAKESLETHRSNDHTKSNSWWMGDAMGIPLVRVCDECEESARDSYDPAIFGVGSYRDAVEDRIEEDDP